MSYRGPNNSNYRQNGRKEKDDRNNGFERNKYRQTMPSNSRYNPLSPPNRNHNNSISPTQSHVSTATNYNQPWSSPQFPIPGTPHRARFAQKPEKNAQNQNAPRPKINFVDFTKKIAGKFKKSESKKQLDTNNLNSTSRMSAPVIKLGESSSESQIRKDELPSTCESASPPKRIRLTSTSKMQPDDRMKMFQRMGREKTMTAAQRMQKERQRDFQLVALPGAVGRACLEETSSQSSSQLSIINEPTATSTPLAPAPSRSISSLCLVTPEPRADADSTLYFSTVGLSRSTPESVCSGSTSRTISVKQEIRDTSSHCPSVSSSTGSRSSEPPACSSTGAANGSSTAFTQPEHLSTLWMVSKAIRERELELEGSMPLLEKYRSRCAEIEKEKTDLTAMKGDTPTEQDMRHLWKLERELQQLIVQINQTGMCIQLAKQWLPILESRRNELLASSPPPPAAPTIPASSFV